MFDMKKVYIALSGITYSFIGVFDINQSLDEIANKLISSGLISDNLSDIDYHENGSYCVNDFNIYGTIEFSGDNGLFYVELRECEIN